MKKILIVILMSLSLSSINVFADVGNKIRHQSSSSSSSRNEGAYTSGYGGYSSGSLDFSSMVIFVVLVGVGLIYMYVKNQNQTTEEIISTNTGNLYTPPSKLALQKIMEVDPLFSNEKMLAYARKVYIALQTAWTQKTWENVRQYETEDLFNMHYQQLNEFIRNQTTNYVERIDIRNAEIIDFEQDQDLHTLKIRLNVILRDYIKNDITNEVISGSMYDDISHTYVLTFVRSANILSKQSEMEEYVCLSCGAKNSIQPDGKCKFCQTTKNQDWLLASID